MKVYFVNINIEGEVIEDIIDFKYEDSINLDNMLQFKISGKQELIYKIDTDVFKTGSNIVFTFGQTRGRISENHVAVLTDIDVIYGKNGRVYVTIRAIDKGTILKKSENIFDWSGKKSSEIVEIIAGRYDMAYQIESTTNVHENLNQCGKNDFEFMMYLALIEGGYIFYIRNNIIHFVQRGLDKDSIVTYEYGNDDSVLAFSTNYRDSITKVEAVKNDVIKVDDDKEVVEDNVTRVDVADVDVNLGNFDLEYLSGSYSTVVKKHLLLPQFQQEEVTNIIDGLVKETKLMTLTGVLTIVGNPLRNPDEIITIAGQLLKRDLGNWYTEKVTHKIDNAGYTTKLYIAKNATDIETNEQSVNSNSTIGEANANEVGNVNNNDYITHAVYDINGDLINYE